MPLYLVAAFLVISSLVGPAHDRRLQAVRATAEPLDVAASRTSRTRVWLLRPPLDVLKRRHPARKIILGGLALSLLLAFAAIALLQRQEANPIVGWLWAASLLVLVLVAARTPTPPSIVRPFPSPSNDFFGLGVPSIPYWVEVPMLIGILLLALTLRLVNLSHMPGIFGDEGERGLVARSINHGDGGSLFGSAWYGVPNLYFYALAWCLRAFGDNLFGARMLSVVSGVLAVLFVYLIGRLCWGPRAGLIAAALLSVSAVALQFSRQATESTPTAALWAAGFFCFLLALRDRTWVAFVLAGVLWGLSLYFYASSRLILPLILALVIFCLLRWRRHFLRLYGPGCVALGVAFVLTAMPYVYVSAENGWVSFLGRAAETSIFTPQNQARAFAARGLPFPGLSAPADRSNSESAIVSVVTHPGPWIKLLFEQTRVTFEVLYKSPDATLFYKIQDHRGSLLPPVLAAITLLGLAYVVFKVWDARFGLLAIFTFFGMLGAILTIDTPSVQRLAGAWPAMMLFPAILLDRVSAAAWPFSRRLARRWTVIPLVGLVAILATQQTYEYFIHYASLCPLCGTTAQAEYVKALGNQYYGYQLGVGDPDNFFGYGSTRFLADGVDGVDLAVPADYCPIIDGHGRGAAFLVYPNNLQYLPVLRQFYPGGREEPIKSTDGVTRFISYKLSAEQLVSMHTVRATYMDQSKNPTSRAEATVGADTGGWSPPTGVTYPLTAVWDGGLLVPQHGVYRLQLDGQDGAVLTLDGKDLVTTNATAPGQNMFAATDVVLARGLHHVVLTSALSHPSDRIAFRWAKNAGNLTGVAAQYLYSGPIGGLSGDVWAWDPGAAINTAAFAPKQQPISQRIDPFIGFREATVSLGSAPFMARWQGRLSAPSTGDFKFEIDSNGPSALFIDGKQIVEHPADGSVSSGSASVPLTQGPHMIELQYAWLRGPARLELYWTSPGSARELVPTMALTPLTGSWPAPAPPIPQRLAASGEPSHP